MTPNETAAWADQLGGPKAREIVERGEIRRKCEKRIELIELLDDFGDGPDWGEWLCRYQKPDGSWADGCIQADPHTMALETLTDEAGNSVDIFYP